MKNSKVKEVIFKAFIMALKLKYFIRANTFLGNKHRVTHSNSHQKLNTQQLPQTMCKRIPCFTKSEDQCQTCFWNFHLQKTVTYTRCY